MSTTDEVQAFARLRPRLFSIAYRMLGIRADAEDVVQDAWLRWSDPGRGQVASTEAWLVSVTTRLAIDRLRAAKVQREHYVGEWLPEPLVGVDERTPEDAAMLASELSVALMWVLERLAPEERAAFLLRQAFDQDYGELAAVLGKSEAACRQLVHRASERVRLETPRFQVAKDVHRRLLERFQFAASRGDGAALRELLAEDVAIVADGGGKVASFMKILRGAARIANLYKAVYLRNAPRLEYRMAQVNGEPGLLRYVDGQLESAQAFVTDGERIVAIYAMRNPDKLGAVDLGK
ncbi:RNA polymerase sigma-70 factor [Massilia sp. 9I]|uniref:RNA polymerase sigma-70 factor n=1 Tax=Massilia sp. 9I TaxID=2653152 RepID=UPI0012F26D72|nr:RNA polymerase sigma-70 factor [Massilia sp. 9I]VXC08784.1 RNA polymerase sigma-70 factor [Massilia sp. 9I]